MDFEDLLVGLVAGLALLWQAVVWLKEQMDKSQADKAQRPRVPPVVLSPRSESELEYSEVDNGVIDVPKHVGTVMPAAVAARTAAERGRSLRQQLGLDRRSALQRSIVLMTVLGPCRANDRSTNNLVS